MPQYTACCNYRQLKVFIKTGRAMIMTSSITRTEKFSSALKSFLQQLREGLATRKANSATAEWDAFLSGALQQSAPSSQDACERRAAMTKVMRNADFRTKIATADWLLLEDNYNGAIALYDRIAADHPDEIGVCLRCVGAAHYFLGNYETAIEFYQKALASGEDADMIAADISEAHDAIFMRDQDRREAA